MIQSSFCKGISRSSERLKALSSHLASKWQTKVKLELVRFQYSTCFTILYCISKDYLIVKMRIIISTRLYFIYRRPETSIFMAPKEGVQMHFTLLILQICKIIKGFFLWMWQLDKLRVDRKPCPDVAHDN